MKPLMLSDVNDGTFETKNVNFVDGMVAQWRVLSAGGRPSWESIVRIPSVTIAITTLSSSLESTFLKPGLELL